MVRWKNSDIFQQGLSPSQDPTPFTTFNLKLKLRLQVHLRSENPGYMSMFGGNLSYPFVLCVWIPP